MSAIREAEDRLLTPEEAGELLQVSGYTMRQWAREGKVPALRLGKFWRFRRASLVAWAADRERTAR